MRPSTSGRKSRSERSYSYFVRPRATDGSCENSTTICEDVLEEWVIGKIRDRLFIGGGNGKLSQTAADFQQLVDDVREELRRALEPESGRSAALEAERQSLQKKLTGWRTTLGNPDLAPCVRADAEYDYATVTARIAEIAAELVGAEAAPRLIDDIASPEVVTERLERFSDVISGENATRGNLELSQHIDRIESSRSAGHDANLHTWRAPRGDRLPRVHGRRLARCG